MSKKLPKSKSEGQDATDGAATQRRKKAASASAKPKPPKTKRTKPAGSAKPSAIDSAAQVLADAKEPMNTRAMIEAMSKNGLWTSPGGKTPWATLYSAILNEINTKGKESRFKKTDRGHFTINK